MAAARSIVPAGAGAAELRRLGADVDHPCPPLSSTCDSSFILSTNEMNGTVGADGSRLGFFRHGPRQGLDGPELAYVETQIGKEAGADMAVAGKPQPIAARAVAAAAPVDHVEAACRPDSSAE